MEDLEKIKQEIADIKARNQRVEADKAWETSIFRTISVLLLTYIVATMVMYAIGINSPYLNALIPTVGFFLSIQSLPFLKRFWIGKYFAKRK